MCKYEIKDASLYEEGDKRIEWVKRYMKVLSLYGDMYEKEQPFKGLRIAMSIHLEAKTAYLALVLKRLGAEVAVTGSNPLSTQDVIAAALVRRGVSVFALHGADGETYERHLNMALDINPHIIIDDGGDLVSLVHTKRRELLPNIIGACEETTTGILRLKSMENEGALEFPVVAVNNAKCKNMFDNRYGTGQSVLDGIMRATNLVIAGKTFVVAGYGWCGRGLAQRAKGLGARVIVTEIDPVKAIEANMDGFDVMPMDSAAPLGDIFVTVTGCSNVITSKHFAMMKDGVLLANAGHFDVEVSVRDLKKDAVESYEARNNVTTYVMKDSRRLNLLAEGRLVNLAAGDGHPAEIMDMSFAIQLAGALMISKKGKDLENKVITVPEEVDMDVARVKLASMGISIDTLTEEQEKYLSSWN
ncbi:MAG: adenosylhomocysteinase [Clostridiales bacterium]|nr:adenosylhomocysteinase [Clostridiales bacterium]